MPSYGHQDSKFCSVIVYRSMEVSSLSFVLWFCTGSRDISPRGDGVSMDACTRANFQCQSKKEKNMMPCPFYTGS